MMGRLKHEQEQLFYEFRLDEVIPGDHLVREIAAVLDLTWVRAELASYYSPLRRPSIDPLAVCGRRLSRRCGGGVSWLAAFLPSARSGCSAGRFRSTWRTAGSAV